MITKRELQTIALFEMARDISANVPGMAEFFDFFVKGRSLNDRKLMHRYLTIKETERLSFLKAAKESGWDKPSPTKA